MSFALDQPDFSVAVRLLAVSATIGLAAGCAGSSSVTRQNADDDTAQPERRAVYPVPVVRYERYTLVEVRPDAAQQDLLEQIIDISLPRAVETTVGDALRIVLQRTGYRLCETDTAARVLYALPLPAVHLELGPLTLREALRTLAGPAWTLDVDTAARRVCFARNDERDPAAKPPPAESGVTSTEPSKRTPSNHGSPGRRHR
jgi:type IV pili sensor histidine kinase/response regulator